MATVPGVLALLFAAFFALWLAGRGNHSGTPHESYLRLETRPIEAAESHSAGRGQPLLEDNALQWLHASVEGYCSTTSDAGDCGRGDKGTWVLPHEVVSEGWHSAAQVSSTGRLVTGQPARVCHPRLNTCVSVPLPQACLGLCRACAQCRVVSLSLKFADCSWFRACNTSRAALHQNPSTFRSGLAAMPVARAHAGPGPAEEAAGRLGGLACFGGACFARGRRPGRGPALEPLHRGASGFGGGMVVEMRSSAHDELDRSQGRRSPLLPMRRVAQPAHDGTPLLLLGLISGQAARRALLRCTWVGALSSLPGVRAKFVIGLEQPDANRTDVLEVRVRENEALQGGGGSGRGMKPGAHTWTQFPKVIAFLWYASVQPERLVAKGDDDVYVSSYGIVSTLSSEAQRPMPNGQCPMPNAQCPMPNAQACWRTRLSSRD